MRKNKIKQMMKEGKPVINGWCAIPSTASAEAMAHQGWDSLTVDMQHGLVDYSNALPMMQTISTTEAVKSTLLESPPLSELPHVTTSPELLRAAKAVSVE